MYILANNYSRIKNYKKTKKISEEIMYIKRRHLKEQKIMILYKQKC